jgi:hypothetical protein
MANTANYMDQGGARWHVGGTQTIESGGILNIASGGKLEFNGVEATADTLAATRVQNLNANAALVVAEELAFVETAGDGTYTGTVALPAGSTLINIIVQSTALWTAGTSASLKVGDGVDDDGFYTATNLKATDLLVGESLSFSNLQDKAGAYITAPAQTIYQATARNVIAVLAKVGTGTAGRTRVLVVYVTPATVVNVAKV